MAAVITPTIQPIDPIKTTAAQAASYKAPTLGAANDQTVDTKQTMQGQLGGILSSGSPLLEQAKTRALQGMNARGLINSSMAVGAGESALYDAAMPIAQFDASRYSDVANRNQDAGNQFKLQQFGADTDAAKISANWTQDANLFNAGESNKAGTNSAQIAANAALRQADIGLDASKANASIDAQKEQQQTEIGAQKDRLAMEITSREAISKLDNDTRQKMAEIEAGYKVQMQSQDSAARLFDQISVQMSQIALNKDLSPEAKRNATTMLMGQLTNGLNILGSVANLNLSSILKFDGLEKMFNTSTVEGLQGAGGGAAPLPAAGGTGAPVGGGSAGTTGGLIGSAPATGNAPAPSAPAGSAGQTHLDNQLSIARMPTAQRDFFGLEYQQAIQSGATPDAAFQQATNRLNDPEYHRVSLPDDGNGISWKSEWQDPASPTHYRREGDRRPVDQAYDYLISQGKTPFEAATILKERAKTELTKDVAPAWDGGA